MTTPPALEIRRLFRQRYGMPPVHVVRCPRPVELLGNLAIDEEGLALAMAVDRDLEMAVAPRLDGKVHLGYEGEEQGIVFSISDLGSAKVDSTTRYLQSVLLHLARRGVSLRGFSALIRKDVSELEGGRNASALCVATALAFRELQPFALTPSGCTVPPSRDARGHVAPPVKQERLEMARLCQAALQDLDGESRNMQPTVTCLFARPFQAVEWDGQSLAIEHVPLAGDVSWVLCQSGDNDPAMRELNHQCRVQGNEGARLMGVKSLRIVDEDRWRQMEKRMPGPALAWVRYSVEEVRRVLFGVRALRAGDFEQFGQLMDQSHERWRELPGTRFADFNLLVDLARLHPGYLGARCVWGDAGLGTINLVRHDQADSFVRAMDVVYEKRTGKKARSRICRIVEGAGVDSDG